MKAGRSIRETADALSAGRLSALQLIEESLAAAERVNPTLNSFITIAAEQARAQAIDSDRRRRTNTAHGLLDGIAYGAKDVFQTHNILTTAGSKVLRDWLPNTSAAPIRQLDAAGAVLLGKTNLHEFAYGATGHNTWAGTAVNPHDPNRLAGGSSSGSAACVASGIVPFALGTDTGGSVRVPAALCGVVGFKPTFGRISLEGVVPLSWSLDHGGILARTVDDVAIVAAGLGVVGGAAQANVRVHTLRVGIVPNWYERCAPAVQRGFEAARQALARSGATFTEIVLPDQAEARTVSLNLQLAEALTYHGPNLRRAGDSFGADIRNGLVLGQFLSAESYIQCKRLMTRYRKTFEARCARIDILLTPACPIPAPMIGTETITLGAECMPLGNALTLFTSFFNLVGAPAAVLPSGADEGGLPVAIQLVGRPNDDARVLGIAAGLEGALMSGTDNDRT